MSAPANDVATKQEALFAILRSMRQVMIAYSGGTDSAYLAWAAGKVLGENALDAASVRGLVGPDMLIGRSVHSAQGAVEAESSGADFLILGTIFETTSHPGADVGGLDLVRSVTLRVGIPVIGIGGISESNIGGLVQAGAAGAAVITAISMAPEPKTASSRISAAMRQAHSNLAELRK